MKHSVLSPIVELLIISPCSALNVRMVKTQRSNATIVQLSSSLIPLLSNANAILDTGIILEMRNSKANFYSFFEIPGKKVITLVVLAMSLVLHAYLLMLAIRAQELWFKIKRQLDIVIAPIKENGNPFSH
jgi:hypothetical protein